MAHAEQVDDIDIVRANQHFFGINFGTSRLPGESAAAFANRLVDFVVTQENVATGTTSRFRLFWEGTTLKAQPIPLASSSATVGQWGHATFALSGTRELG